RCICKVITTGRKYEKDCDMAHDGQMDGAAGAVLLNNLTDLTRAALAPVDSIFEVAKAAIQAKVTEGGRVSGPLVDRHQSAAHGLAWLATYATALRQMQAWAEKLSETGSFGEV